MYVMERNDPASSRPLSNDEAREIHVQSEKQITDCIAPPAGDPALATLVGMGSLAVNRPRRGLVRIRAPRPQGFVASL